MATYSEETVVVAVKITLLIAIILVGVPGNLMSIYTNRKELSRNKLNGVAYLHMGVTDLVLCCLYSSTILMLEAAGYHSLNRELGDLGVWEPLINFIYKEINPKIFYCSSFISLNSLTIMAAIRVWRMLFPFKEPRINLWAAVFIFTDIIGVALSFILTVPTNHLYNLNGRNISSFNFTGGVIPGYLETNNVTTWPQTTGSNVTESLINNATDAPYSQGDGITRITATNYSGKILQAAVGFSVIFITFAYTIICIIMKRTDNALASSQKKLFVKRQRAHLITHGILCVVLAITYIPAFVRNFFPDASLAVTGLMLSIAVANSAVNPYVYCVLFAENRRKIRNWVQCKTCDK